MPASTAVHSPSESGDIITAPLCLLKNKFHGTLLCLICLNDPSDRVCFLCATHYRQGTLWIHRILTLGNIIIIYDLNKLQQRIPA